MINDTKHFFIIEEGTGYIDGWYTFITQKRYEKESLDLCLSWDNKRPQYRHYPCILDNDKVFYISDDICLPRQSVIEDNQMFVGGNSEYQQGVRNMASNLLEAAVDIYGDQVISMANLAGLICEIKDNDGYQPKNLKTRYLKNIDHNRNGVTYIHQPYRDK